MADEESQSDELLALASIYDNSVFYCQEESKLPSGQFTAHLDLPQPFTVIHTSKGIVKEYVVEHLPPISLYFELPVDYPSSNTPSFTLSAKWLTLEQLSKLCARLDEIAEENHGEVVLFSWTSFLQDETVEYLQIESPVQLNSIVNNNLPNLSPSEKLNPASNGRSDADLLFENNSKSPKTANKNEESGASLTQHSESEITLKQDGDKVLEIAKYNTDPRAVQDVANSELLLAAILDHNEQRKEQVFQTTLFNCPVCFLEKMGEVCMKFVGCGHVYCKDCMSAYFELQINEGSVSALTCPHDKCDIQAHPAQIRELVSPQLYSRYDRLLLQCTLDTMADIMYCPRTACGSVVLVDSENNMGSCPECKYVFCIFCKKVYHGVAPCKIQSNEIKKIRSEYEQGTEAEKRLLEKRYGVRMIKGIIEDSYTAQWLEEHSKKCPSCRTHIQKIDGCNKMTCTKCRSFFCWLCGAMLPRGNPYAHFNAMDSKCFNQLFAGVVMDEYDDFDEQYEFWNG